MSRLAPVVVATALTALAACGGGSSPIDGGAASELHREVVAVRTAAEARDVDTAARALDELRTSVARPRAGDHISAGRAAELRAAEAAVRAQLVSITTTTTTTTTVPAPKGKQGEDGGDQGGGNGNGNGRGNGG